jgi:hypothetical protein
MFFPTPRCAIRENILELDLEGRLTMIHTTAFLRIAMTVTVCLASIACAATPLWQGKGRIAISSDGNEHDCDDWAATPFTLALIAAKGLQNRVTLYTYSDHVWGSNQDHSDARKQMNTSAKDGARIFGYDTSRFIEAVSNPEKAYNALRDAIDASSATDPLLIIAAGPMQVEGEAIKRSNPAKHPFVTILSHSDWNNKHADNPSNWENHSGWTWTEIGTATKSTGLKMVQIVDQNGGSGYDGMRAASSKFQWLKTSASRTKAPWSASQWDWLHARQQTCIKSGDFDPSDAGMVIYAMTGNEKTDPSDAQAIMEHAGGTAGATYSSIGTDARNGITVHDLNGKNLGRYATVEEFLGRSGPRQVGNAVLARTNSGKTFHLAPF